MVSFRQTHLSQKRHAGFQKTRKTLAAGCSTVNRAWGFKNTPPTTKLIFQKRKKRLRPPVQPKAIVGLTTPYKNAISMTGFLILANIGIK